MARTMPPSTASTTGTSPRHAAHACRARRRPQDAPPLVLLHGWPQHWYLWRNVIPAVADRYRVLAPDLRGFGWSDAPAGGYRKERMASDVLGLLDALGVERAQLVGHDWGGWIGFLLGAPRPRALREATSR